MQARPADAEATPDFTGLSLEQLMAMEVTSAAKRPEALENTPAAVFVLTGEDIRRSGATSIPEVLRLVPGLQVAQINASSWAVSSRGFNGRFANKLLVLIDGRSIYTPLFSGVYWDRQDTLLDDVDRIEVIRGPGATLWGANAVNGVINIITRPAAATQGGLASLAGGNQEQIAAYRYGGAVGDDVHYRLQAKGAMRDDRDTAAGASGGDDWHAGRAAFRVDGAAGPDRAWQLQGDAYRGEIGETFTLATLEPPYSVPGETRTDTAGAYLLGRWDQALGDRAAVSVQGYVDHRSFDDVRIGARQDTIDLEFEHSTALADRHQLVWGAGYRVWRDSLDSTFAISFEDETETYRLASAFVQDTIALIPDTLDLTLGSKLEHNSYTGFELQPSARVLWHADARNTVWAAVSRAVRTPSRSERTIRLVSSTIPPSTADNPAPLPVLVTAFGSNDFESETLTAYELGYRFRRGSAFFLDVAGFFNSYDDLISVRAEPAVPETAPSPHLVAPFVAANDVAADTYGIETAATWQVRSGWRLQLGYSYLHIDLHARDLSPDSAINGPEGTSPRHQVSLRSLADISETVTFDATFRYVDALPALDVDAYATVDLRLGWRPREDLELALVGRNLLGTHLEFGSERILAMTPTEAAPAVLGTLTWRH